MPVEVAVARADTVVDAILATGQIEAMQSIELRPDVEGRIVEILVREGAVVAAGTPLFKVDDAELKAQVARAEAERDLARQSLTRTRDLLARRRRARRSWSAPRPRRGAPRRSSSCSRCGWTGPWSARRSPASWASAREPGRLRDHRHPAGRPADGLTRSGPSFQVPERYAEQLQGRAAGHVPGGGAAGPGVHRHGGLRRSRGAAPRAHDHWSRRWCRTAAGAAGGHVHRGPARHGRAARARWSSRRTRCSRCRARTSSGSSPTARRPGARSSSASARPASSRSRSGVEAGEQVVVGGQERLAEGAPGLAQGGRARTPAARSSDS